MAALNQTDLGSTYSMLLLRGEMGYTDMEKRQLFLRSYQFSRKKKTLRERITRSFFRVRRVLWVRLKSVKKLRKFVWFRLRYCGLFNHGSRKRSFFLRLQNSF